MKISPSSWFTVHFIHRVLRGNLKLHCLRDRCLDVLKGISGIPNFFPLWPHLDFRLLLRTRVQGSTPEGVKNRAEHEDLPVILVLRRRLQTLIHRWLSLQIAKKVL